MISSSIPASPGIRKKCIMLFQGACIPIIIFETVFNDVYNYYFRKMRDDDQIFVFLQKKPAKFDEARGEREEQTKNPLEDSSHISAASKNSKIFRESIKADPGGFEPPTHGLEGRCPVLTRPRAHESYFTIYTSLHIYFFTFMLS